MTDYKVQPGDPVRAQLWNNVIDRLPEATLGGGGAATAFYGQSIIPMINKTTEAVELGELVVVERYNGDTQDPFTAADSMEFEAVRPEWHDKIAAVAVVLEPCKADDVFSACIDGLCLIKTTSNAGGWVFVDPVTPAEGKCSESGFGQKLADFGADHAICMLIRYQTWWRFKLTDDHPGSGSAAAYLLQFIGDEYGGDITLTDPDNFMVDQKVYCQLY